MVKHQILHDSEKSLDFKITFLQVCAFYHDTKKSKKLKILVTHQGWLGKGNTEVSSLEGLLAGTNDAE